MCDLPHGALPILVGRVCRTLRPYRSIVVVAAAEYVWSVVGGRSSKRCGIGTAQLLTWVRECMFAAGYDGVFQFRSFRVEGLRIWQVHDRLSTGSFNGAAGQEVVEHRCA